MSIDPSVMVGRAAYHLELHVQRVVVPAAAAGVAAVLDVDVDVVVSRRQNMPAAAVGGGGRLLRMLLCG